MSSINTNIPATIAQNALRRANLSLDTAMERLSSGRRINSGSDDPAGLSIGTRVKSSAMTDRQAARNANNVISMLQSYSETGRTVIDMLSQMKLLAQRASADTFDASQRFEMDNHFNVLGQAWFAAAALSHWNDDVTRMNTFNGSFVIQLGGGTSDAITMALKSWDPTNATANQNITGATTGSADDANASTTRAWSFAKTLGSLTATTFGNERSHSHIQSQAAAAGAIAKLERVIEGAAAEVSRYEAYISRLEHASNNANEVAVQKEKGHSNIVNANYALETTELARAQIITQAATAILAQANQTPQMLLELLR